jgi:hypothetical protein
VRARVIQADYAQLASIALPVGLLYEMATQLRINFRENDLLNDFFDSDATLCLRTVTKTDGQSKAARLLRTNRVSGYQLLNEPAAN